VVKGDVIAAVQQLS
jgi:hypothetical protein